jgi:hypothetical protein
MILVPSRNIGDIDGSSASQGEWIFPKCFRRQKIGHIKTESLLRRGRHDVHFGFHTLPPELKFVHGFLPADFFYVITRSEIQRAAWTNGRAHWLLANAGAVVTHVALHHQIILRLHFWNTKRASQNTVRAGDASGFCGAVDHASIILLDRVSWTNFCASGILAVHANDGCRLYSAATMHVVQVNHRLSAMGVAFATRLHTGLAANAARLVDEKFVFGESFHGFFK